MAPVNEINRSPREPSRTSAIPSRVGEAKGGPVLCATCGHLDVLHDAGGCAVGSTAAWLATRCPCPALTLADEINR